MFSQVHQDARNRFDKLGEIQNKISKSQQELSQLLGLGELLEPDDIVKSSAKLVAHGVEPHIVATWLADMPQASGEPLVGWLQTHLGQLNQAAQALAPMREQARHHLGMTALAALASEHVGGPGYLASGGAGQQRPSPSSNPLAEPASLPVAPPGNNLLH